MLDPNPHQVILTSSYVLMKGYYNGDKHHDEGSFSYGCIQRYHFEKLPFGVCASYGTFFTNLRSWGVALGLRPCIGWSLGFFVVYTFGGPPTL